MVSEEKRRRKKDIRSVNAMKQLLSHCFVYTMYVALDLNWKQKNKNKKSKLNSTKKGLKRKREQKKTEKNIYSKYNKNLLQKADSVIESSCPSVCMSVCMFVWMFALGWNF